MRQFAGSFNNDAGQIVTFRLLRTTLRSYRPRVGFEGSDNEWREEYLLGPWVLGLRFRVIGV